MLVGKTWLIPRIRMWLTSLPNRPRLLIEPFAGGGIVSLTAGFEHLAEHVILVELDVDVGAVWQTILQGDAQWLANRILNFELTPENVEAELAEQNGDVQGHAFRTILRNRVNRGGILAAGAGLIKYGENGKGLASRWYPETLHRRILEIAQIRNRFTFIQGDGLTVMQEHANEADVVYFIDPPYTAGAAGKRAGNRLYTHATLDHEALFDLTGTVAGDFLMTYDNDPEVRTLARGHQFDMELVPMKSTHHAEMTELLIGRHLDWAR
jgi:DNA adenine methylase